MVEVKFLYTFYGTWSDTKEPWNHTFLSETDDDLVVQDLLLDLAMKDRRFQDMDVMGFFRRDNMKDTWTPGIIRCKGDGEFWYMVEPVLWSDNRAFKLKEIDFYEGGGRLL